MTARARIRYLAITAKEPELLARYYATYFGMWLLGLTPTRLGHLASQPVRP